MADNASHGDAGLRLKKGDYTRQLMWDQGKPGFERFGDASCPTYCQICGLCCLLPVPAGDGKHKFGTVL